MSDKQTTENAVDYKATLNLPGTEFAMKANLAVREAKWLEEWYADNIYQQIRASRIGKKKYVLHDGPPYANGQIHLGHAVNKVLKDIIIKSRILDGFDAPYVPGWDCHGLPIELKVEEKVGKVGVKVDASTFRKACREYAYTQVELQKKDFVRMGVFGDWDNPYLTMNFKQEADIVRSVGAIAKAGHIEPGLKPVNWCLDCGSALAEAEVEYEDKKSDAIDVGFTVVDLKDLSARLNINVEAATDIVIWTTTPWTLPANQAVAVHAEIDYQLVQVSTDRGVQNFILAKDLVESAVKRYKLENPVVLADFNGSAIENLLLQHPLLTDRQVPVILGEHVIATSGTGAVHTAPGHGVDDYKVGLQYNLKVENPVGGNGVYLPTSPIFAGEHIYKANPKIIEALSAVGRLWAHQPIKHSYPHCWRHKTPIIFRATPQWFISMDAQGLRQKALNAIENEISFVPDWGKNRIQAMIEGRPDWCISRQRTWGVPIPFFVHKDTNELHPRTAELIEEVAKLIEQEGIDAWYNREAKDFIGDEAEQYNCVRDTLDVWFDSGTTHRHVLRGSHPHGHESGPRADLYLEGSDQHRGWFHSSLLTGAAIDGHAPYRQLLTHGFTVDAQGRKMSKSIGNVVAPQSVMDKLGADILRLWVASTDYSGEMAVSDEILKRTADVYRRIRNTARFLLSNLNGFDPKRDQVAFGDMLALDQWVVDRAAQLPGRIETAYEEYRFLDVYQQVHGFCARELGGFYLDVIKDRQYTTQTDSLARRSAQTALYHVVEALSRWVAPILSFTAEEIFEHIPGERGDSVLLETYYTGLSTLDEGAEMGRAFWEQVLEVKHSVNKCLEDARNAKVIKGSLAAEVTLFVNDELHATLAKLGDELRFVMLTSEVHLAPLADAANAESTELEGLKVAVSASGHAKCERCWHHRADVGSVAEHPDLCGRCVSNLPEGSGEIRHYA